LSGVNLNPIMELNLIIALALAFGIGLSLGLLGKNHRHTRMDLCN